MAIHLGGFFEDIDAAGAIVNLAAIADDVLTTNGDDLRVPDLNRVIAIAAGVASGGDGYARLDAPSLLKKTRQYISPVNGNADADAEPDSPPAVEDLRNNPLVLRPTEDLEAVVDSDTAAAAKQWVMLWFSDSQPQRPVGDIFTVRATSAIALVADVWSLVQLTFQDNLPAGKYAVVGLSAISAGLIAARYVFRGGVGWRPGCLGRDSDSDKEDPMFRKGGLGVWGEFDHVTPPAIECLSISADATQDFLLDLIQIQAF